MAAIRPGPCGELIDCDDFKRAQIPVPAQYVHADHIDVGAAVPDMGNHLIDAKSPELVVQGREFTHTFIFGAYDGQITFYEPMITLRLSPEPARYCACRSSSRRHGRPKATTRPPTASAISRTRSGTPCRSKISSTGPRTSRAGARFVRAAKYRAAPPAVR